MNVDSSMSIESYVSNGSVITKRELLMYLATVIHTIQDISTVSKEIENRKLLIKAKEIETRRTEYKLPIMEKPTGLSSLSRAKTKRYRKWLDEAPMREAEIKKKNEDEDRRVAEAEKKLAELRLEQSKDCEQKNHAEEQLQYLFSQNILSEEYTDMLPLFTITGYLVKNRAHTLTDAINLYHQEKHWKQMENMMEDQGRAARIHHKHMEEQQYQQQRFLQNMAVRQMNEMQEMHRKLDAISSDAADAKFFAEMAYIKSLFND